MTSQRDVHLEEIRAIRAELLELVDGMDYCLDWKPDEASWCVREVVYHLLDTQPGGIHSVLRGIISGELDEFELWSDRDNMTPERQGYYLESIVEDIDGLFQGLELALESATDGDLSGKSAMVHQRNREWDEPRTVENLLEGLFARHWREHLGQIRELRDSLGM